MGRQVNTAKPSLLGSKKLDLVERQEAEIAFNWPTLTRYLAEREQATRRPTVIGQVSRASACEAFIYRNET